MKLLGKILLKIFIGLLAMICTFALIQPLLYTQYYKSAKKEFRVNGLLDGLIPQGMTYVAEENVWLYTGYMKDNLPSRLYVVTEDSSRYIELYTPDGAYKGHAGGISYENDVVYIASGGSGESNRVYMFSLTEVLDETTTKIVMDNHFHPYSKASYCYVNDGILWIGEFEMGDKFPTDESHHVNTNKALIVGYELNEYGLVDEEVDIVLSSGSKVQGMAMDAEGKIALSTSYGVASSSLKYYSSLDNQQEYTFTIDNKEVPLYILDGASLIIDVKAPQMAEGIVFKDGRLHVLYESATLKYYFGILTKGRYVHSYDFYYIEK